MVEKIYLLNLIYFIAILDSSSALNAHQNVGIVIKLKSK